MKYFHDDARETRASTTRAQIMLDSDGMHIACAAILPWMQLLKAAMFLMVIMGITCGYVVGYFGTLDQVVPKIQHILEVPILNLAIQVLLLLLG